MPNNSAIFELTLDPVIRPNETIYHSVESLTARITDFGNVYIIPPICLFGILTNFISIIALAKMKFKQNTIHQFMFIVSLNDFLYLFLPVFLAIIRCGAICPLAYKYESKFYELYVYLFVGNSMMTFANLLDIFVSCNRLLAFSSSVQKSSQISLKWKLITSSILSVLINIAVIILPKSVQKIGLLEVVDNLTHVSYDPIYKVGLNSIGKDAIGELIVTILTFTRTTCLIILLFFLNLIIGFKYRKHMIKKKLIAYTISAQREANRKKEKHWKANIKVTKMVFIMGCAYLVGDFPFGVAAILSAINFNPYIYSIYQLYSNSSLFASFGCNFFIYYFFDVKFQAMLRNVFGLGSRDLNERSRSDGSKSKSKFTQNFTR